MDLIVITCNFSLHKSLTDGLELCGLLEDYCLHQLFALSFWRHPFTTEHPLLSKWCNATFLRICSYEKTNSCTSWMAWGWVNIHQFKILGWTIPLNISHVSLFFVSRPVACQHVACVLRYIRAQNVSWSVDEGLFYRVCLLANHRVRTKGETETEKSNVH